MISQLGFKGQMDETDYTGGKDILEEAARTKVLEGDRELKSCVLTVS